MNIFEVVLLGIIQGLTEFIPVSSSAHIFLASKILDIDTQSSNISTTIIFLHIGTVLAAIYYYRQVLYEIFLSVFKVIFSRVTAKAKDKFNLKIAFLLTISTIPIGIAGTFLEEFISKIYLEDTARPIILTSTALFVLSLYFILLPYLLPHKRINYKNIGFKQALLVGIFQIPAILYGVSRSGMTISGAEFAGLKRKDALKYSFLLSIPVILGASMYEILLSGNISLTEIKYQWDVIIIGVVSSFISGYIAISFLLSFLKTQSLRSFGFYLIMIGILALMFLPQ